MPDFLAEALTWSENYLITTAIELAVELKMPPTEFINPNRKPSGEWSGLDKKLAMAYKMMIRETCGLCNNPIWVCRNTDHNIDFSIRTGTCYSKKALERDENARAKRKNGKLKEGQYLYSVPMQVNGEELPRGLRKQYFDSLSEE